MMTREPDERDVPLDAETEELLYALEEKTGTPRGVLVANILRDILRDREFWNGVNDPVGVGKPH